MKKWTVMITAILMVAGAQAAALEDWQFNDADGTQLNAVTNTGSVGTSWNFGGPRTHTGGVNIGDSKWYAWDPGSGTTYRTASFAALTNGQVTFEFVISDWDMAGTDGLGVLNNGIKFNFGHTTNGSAQLEFEAGSTTDIRVRSQGSNNGNLSGTDVGNYLGALNLTNTASVTVQLNADLDTGIWSTQVDFGSGFVDLVTNGTGMTMIDRIQLIVDASNGTWEYGGVNGTATEFIKIDSVTLTEVIFEPWTKLETFDFEEASGKSFNTFANSGTLDSEWNYGGPLANFFTDSSGNLVVSNNAGQIFRKIPKAGTANAAPGADEYATPFSTGKYRLDMDLTSWELDSAVGSTLTWAALDAASGGSIAAGIRLEVTDATTAKLKIFHSDSNFRSFDFGLTNAAGLAAAIEFDFDAGTATYYTNGIQTHSFGNFTNDLPVATLQFNLSGSWTAGSTVKIGEMGFSQYDAGEAPTNTPTSLWEDWLSDFTVGSETGLLDHADSDDLDNLTEYAFGGDPADGGLLGNTPTQSQVAAGGTNYIEYIYFERDDAVDRGLESILTVGPDLVNTNWADGSLYEVSSGAATGKPGFNAVTNRIPTDVEDQQFIRLQILFTP